jgi:uncharacterized membrane protein YfcA
MANTQEEVAAAEKSVDMAVGQATQHGSLASPNGGEGRSATHPAAWTPELVSHLSLGIGLFAIGSFALVTFLLWKRRNAEQILRTFGILIIVFAAVFLVIAGYSDTQITPVIGLLGTIAGYLLGRRIEPATSEPDRRGQRED